MSAGWEGQSWDLPELLAHLAAGPVPGLGPGWRAQHLEYTPRWVRGKGAGRWVEVRLLDDPEEARAAAAHRGWRWGRFVFAGPDGPGSLRAALRAALADGL